MKERLENLNSSKNGVDLVWITPNTEEIITYCARVSSPENQSKLETAPKLLSYCIKHGHWSIFEQANMCLQIVTGRDIAPQILRHKSFSFQESSFRYSKALSYEERGARSQDLKNRQNSIDDLSEEDKSWFKGAQKEVWEKCYENYELALSKGVAKECARALLPLNTQTKLYMNGSIRSWIHYIQLRSANGTQKEHMEIAEKAKKIFAEHLPNIAKALEWNSDNS
jgi:thymidylate synthase (FAD)